MTEASPADSPALRRHAMYATEYLGFWLRKMGAQTRAREVLGSLVTRYCLDPDPEARRIAASLPRWRRVPARFRKNPRGD